MRNTLYKRIEVYFVVTCVTIIFNYQVLKVVRLPCDSDQVYTLIAAKDVTLFLINIPSYKYRTPPQSNTPTKIASTSLGLCYGRRVNKSVQRGRKVQIGFSRRKREEKRRGRG